MAPTHWLLLQGDLLAPLADGFHHGKRHTNAQASTLDVSNEDRPSCAKGRRGKKTKVRRKAFTHLSAPALSGGPLMHRGSWGCFLKATPSTPSPNPPNIGAQASSKGMGHRKEHRPYYSSCSLICFSPSQNLPYKPITSCVSFLVLV